MWHVGDGLQMNLRHMSGMSMSYDMNATDFDVGRWFVGAVSNGTVEISIESFIRPFFNVGWQKIIEKV